MQPFDASTATRNKALDKRVGIKLRVTGDGTPNGLSIIDAETGAQLFYVESVILQIQRDKPPTAIIRVANVEIDAMATVDVVQEGLANGHH